MSSESVLTDDANGARQTQTENGTEIRYRYDNLGALKSVTKSGQTIDYITDATGRRVGRKVNGSVESYFTYQDSLRPIAQYNADGSIRWTIVYADRLNVPSLLISSNGTRYRVVSDHLGSVRLIINTLSGQIVQRMDYDVWGKVTHDSNPNFQPFGFAGGLYDSATELVRFDARDYDPHVGRWLSKDPIGFAGEDTNLYGYVIQDPVNWVDPIGHGKISAIKEALRLIYEKLGIPGPIKKEKGKDKGKFGSPQRGDDKFGYRLDPGHEGHKPPEDKPRINYWDYRNGKRNKGGISGAIGIDQTNVGFVIPLSTAGHDIFGDNILGDIVDFFNPLSDFQEIIDLFQETEDLGFVPLQCDI